MIRKSVSNFWKFSLTNADTILWILFGCALALGINTRIQALDLPPSGTFDEPTYIRAARSYQVGTFAYQDHPPLGFLLMTVGLGIAGDTTLGWRLASLLSGLAIVAIAGTLAWKLFQSRVAAILAVVFTLIEGMLITYSRVSLLDSTLIAFTLGTLLVAVTAKTERQFITRVGIMLGLACSVKYSAAFILPAILWIMFKKKWWEGAWCIPLGMVVYGLILVGAQVLTHSPTPIRDALTWQTFSLDFHTHLRKLDGTAWFTWPVGFVPFYLDGGKLELPYQATMLRLVFPNPLLAWLSFFVSICAAIVVGARVLPRERQNHALASYVPLLIAGFGLWIIWACVGRPTYLYHYLPAYTCFLIVTAGVLGSVWRKAPMAVIGLTTLLIWTSWYYSPVWEMRPLSLEAMSNRFPLSSWSEPISRALE